MSVELPVWATLALRQVSIAALVRKSVGRPDQTDLAPREVAIPVKAAWSMPAEVRSPAKPADGVAAVSGLCPLHHLLHHISG